MWRFIKFIIYLLLITFIGSWFFQNSQIINIFYKDFIIETNTFFLIIIIALITIFFLLIQRFLFFFKQTTIKYKFNKQYLSYKKGHEAFLHGMIAITNKDYSRAIAESKKINKYLKDDSLSLLLEAESLKVQNKNADLYQVYEVMLNNPNTYLLGLRGLMQENLRSQDYHHAYIYAEKLFNYNPKIDKLYDTIINIISKTNNWQKLIEITDSAFRKKIINKNTYSENKSIALFEIAKVKYLTSLDESIKLMEQCLKLKEFFQPFVSFYTEMLIASNSYKKAKKYLIKAWNYNPHPKLKDDIKKLSKAMKISYLEIAKLCKSNSNDEYETKLLMSESFIDSKKWQEARKEIADLLSHKPSKEVCLLMSKIEEGDTNDPQKIDTWVTRSNYADFSKIWICQISSISQPDWNSVSNGGYFNSLKWQTPQTNQETINSKLSNNIIKYI